MCRPIVTWGQGQFLPKTSRRGPASVQKQVNCARNARRSARNPVGFCPLRRCSLVTPETARQGAASLERLSSFIHEKTGYNLYERYVIEDNGTSVTIYNSDSPVLRKRPCFQSFSFELPT